LADGFEGQIAVGDAANVGIAKVSPFLRWEQRDRFELLSGLGQAQRRSNHLAEARVTLKAAVVGLATITSDHPSIFNERRLGRARVELALALESLHATPSELIPVVASASKWLHDTNSPSHELDRLSEHKHM
jgi:hypothetical protein